MSTGLGGGARSVSIDELVALADEIAALVRAGVPLEQGLAEVAAELPGRLGRIAMDMSRRLEAGESLSQLLAGDEQTFPPLFRAVVDAGLRSGDLAAALEGLATTGRRVAELRRAIGAALVYPMAVVALAFGLFIWVVLFLAPRMLAAYEDLAARSDPFLASLVWLGQHADWWAIPVPVAVVALLGYRWVRSGRAAITDDRRSRWSTIRRTLQDGRMATFAELLALQVRQRIPLDEAIVLAADASGQKALASAARQVADRHREGWVFDDGDAVPSPFPPLLGWMVLAGRQQPDLAHTLEIAAEGYRQRAARKATWASIYLPIVLTAVFGGSVTLLQALVTCGAYWKMLFDLAQP